MGRGTVLGQELRNDITGLDDVSLTSRGDVLQAAEVPVARVVLRLQTLKGSTELGKEEVRGKCTRHTVLVDEVDILERVSEEIRGLDVDLVLAGKESLKVDFDNGSNMVEADPVQKGSAFWQFNN